MEVVRDGVVVSEEPWVAGSPGASELTEQLLAPLWSGNPASTALLLVTGLGAGLFTVAMLYTFVAGIGVWGNDVPNAWAVAIVSFVWWIGIGHAGTFISAFLLLLEQPWRASINRIAESMTLFALVCAGLYPLLHLGRAWYFYWLVPYPATMQLWPQFRSALPWDIAAILTYTLVSILFWYLGLVPDLAAARDRAPERWRARIYGLFALGWRGSVRHWRHHRMAYVLLAGLATPLVISVHSIVGLDFAITDVPGWHSTFFPPFFVVGALHSGFAMVLVLLVPTRRALGLENVVTDRHVDLVGRLLLVTACLMAWGYGTESFIAWYSGDHAEIQTMIHWRLFGPYAWAFWGMVACNALLPQLLWWRGVRRTGWVVALLGVVVLVGMWLERFVIVVGSLSHGALPGAWGTYTPTLIDGVLFFGSVSLFLFLFLLFLRFVPVVPVHEVKELGHG